MVTATLITASILSQSGVAVVVVGGTTTVVGFADGGTVTVDVGTAEPLVTVVAAGAGAGA
jgi:hypothetical protein